MGVVARVSWDRSTYVSLDSEYAASGKGGAQLQVGGCDEVSGTTAGPSRQAHQGELQLSPFAHESLAEQR